MSQALSFVLFPYAESEAEDPQLAMKCIETLERNGFDIQGSIAAYSTATLLTFVQWLTMEGVLPPSRLGGNVELVASFLRQGCGKDIEETIASVTMANNLLEINNAILEQGGQND